MNRGLLSILIPLYNEEEYIQELLRRVLAAPLPDGFEREIVIVDDCSKDASVSEVEAFARRHPDARIRLIRLDRNQGKGAAVRRAIQEATGEFSIIQDADLEYNPNEFTKLLRPLLTGEAEVVYGSRFMAAGERRVLYYWHSLANRILTTLCNIAADVNLTDMETCYKAFRTSFAQTIPIESNRFGLEPELTIKFARRKARIYETPITYHGRTYEEGKKIGAKDAIEALWVILRSRFSSKLYVDAGHSTLDALSFAPKFNRWMADTILPYVGKDVLEIGAGVGNMSRHLSARRQSYVASDINSEYVGQLDNLFCHRPYFVARTLDATRAEDYAPFERQMDTVVCLNVLEHIEDDLATLRSIRTLLQPGGRLILLVPNDPRAYGTVDKEIGHYRRYTPAHLRQLVGEAGYEVDDILKFNRVSMPAWRITGQIRKARTLSRSALTVFDRFVWLWRKIDKTLPWEATSVIAIARRAD
ncbi:MAG TPA: bifunctional glycosyltransferase/class I SAM-dependent methyltransferase, partial [Bryobacteraceae bacterium]|jgi:glycosyltransferase involved in cell wall biosynthesis|nr:bifunctional glycosyltransferase/class I SAM-dependent methyltransferase [Bryobacteraceae bacterium]